MTIAERIVFLLRRLGSHREQEFIDSLGAPILEIRAALLNLQAAGRIESFGNNRWRLIPGRDFVPTNNPGTR